MVEGHECGGSIAVMLGLIRRFESQAAVGQIVMKTLLSGGRLETALTRNMSEDYECSGQC